MILHNKTDITARLNLLGYAVDETVPGYKLADVLKRFQVGSFTPDGKPLTVDGDYGPQTESALFGIYVPVGVSLIQAVLAVARSQVGLMEVPVGSNSGPQIRAILKSVGLGVGYPYCAAGIHWTFGQASRMLDIKNPNPPQAGVLNLWDLAGYKQSGMHRITADEAHANPALVKPGMQGLLKLGATVGHTFLVEETQKSGKLDTIEFNTNQGLSRDGIGIFELTRRTIQSVNLGFISYE